MIRWVIRPSTERSTEGHITYRFGLVPRLVPLFGSVPAAVVGPLAACSTQRNVSAGSAEWGSEAAPPLVVREPDGQGAFRGELLNPHLLRSSRYPRPLPAALLAEGDEGAHRRGRVHP